MSRPPLNAHRHFQCMTVKGAFHLFIDVTAMCVQVAGAVAGECGAWALRSTIQGHCGTHCVRCMRSRDKSETVRGDNRSATLF